MPRLRGRAFRLPGDARDVLKANKPLSTAPVARSLPLRPFSRAQTAQQTRTRVWDRSGGPGRLPAPRLPWVGIWAEFLPEWAEASAGKLGGLEKRSWSQQDGEEEEEGGMLSV